MSAVDEQPDRTVGGWSVKHFAQSNPVGAGRGDVPALLRRVADTISGLGDILVQDITFRSEPTADEQDISMTVYYHEAAGSR